MLNRVAVAAVVLTLPTVFLVAKLATGSLVEVIAPIATFAAFGIGIGVAYVRIRYFICPQCGKHFTVRRTLATNSAGRKCVHCGLDAYTEA